MRKVVKYGFIYPLFQFIIKVFYYINIVEWFKNAVLFFIKNKENKKKYSRVIVDIFICIKWLFIVILIFTESFNQIYLFFISYLIFTNIFTYFYYHIWEQKEIKDPNINKRGFLHLMLAFFYSNISFSYIYILFDNWHIGLSIHSNSKVLSSFLYSMANSLTIGYDKIIIHSNLGYVFSISQVFISFVFVSLVIANSIPKNTYTK